MGARVVKARSISGICLALLAAGPAAADLPLCSANQLKVFTPNYDESLAHRPSAMPTIDYPFGTRRQNWNFEIRVALDEAGRVTCYAMPEDAGPAVVLEDNRRAALAQLAGKTYVPFLKYGKPVPAVVREFIAEQELPESKVPMPSVPLKDVEITLKRTSCFGTCPDYEIRIRGDGRVSYKGEYWVDVRGVYRYRVPADAVAKLVQSARARNLWSMRAKYDGQISDVPTYYLTLRVGNQTHSITDYAGRGAGMPVAVDEFQDEVDAVAHSANWLHLSLESLDSLRKSGFKFYSRAGADLLARAIANEEARDDAAILKLIELSAPIDGKADSELSQDPQRSTLENALILGRESLIEPLLARGALNTRGTLDQEKLDRAFRAAIHSARFGAVQKIWNAGGKSRPALQFTSRENEDDVAGKVVPVTLSLGASAPFKGAWEGRQIIEWLATLGCDPKVTRVDGFSLLHIAASANDVDAVRYLLAQGLSASQLDNHDLPPYSDTESEDLALLLLEAGMDRSEGTWAGKGARTYAEHRHWERVVAWLDAR